MSLSVTSNNSLKVDRILKENIELEKKLSFSKNSVRITKIVGIVCLVAAISAIAIGVFLACFKILPGIISVVCVCNPGILCGGFSMPCLALNVIFSKNAKIWAQDLAANLRKIGDRYFDQMKHVEALKYYNQALDLLRLELEQDHTSTAINLDRIGMYYYNLEAYDEALKYFQEALSIWRVKKKAKPHVPITLYLMVACCEKLNKNEDVIKYSREGQDIHNAIIKEDYYMSSDILKLFSKKLGVLEEKSSKVNLNHTIENAV